MPEIESLASGNILKGVPDTIDQAALQILREAIMEKIDQIFTEGGHDAIMASDDPLKAMFELGLQRFASEFTIKGITNIPANGPVVMAQNHPFPFVDDFAMMLTVTEAFPQRPWAFIGNVHSITHYFPDWQKHPSFSHRIIPVRRENNNSWGKVENGREAIQAATEFLKMHVNPILFMAPDGPDSILQDRIATPHIGFAKIAKAANAQVVPALFTGQADLANLTFQVHGKILAPFSAENQHETEIIQSWSAQILAAIKST